MPRPLRPIADGLIYQMTDSDPWTKSFLNEAGKVDNPMLKKPTIQPKPTIQRNK
jgi:hypothetical protein